MASIIQPNEIYKLRVDLSIIQSPVDFYDQSDDAGILIELRETLLVVLRLH